MSNIDVSENFAEADGCFENYDSYSTVQKFALLNQRHVDIRVFEPSTITTGVEMLLLDTMSMSELNGLQMSALNSSLPIRSAEPWTVGTLGFQADRNHWRGISLTCNTGVTTTDSVTDPVDIEAEFSDSDFISVALPAFPLSNVTLASCSITFTSNASGDFTAGPSATVTFNQSTIPLVNGDSELRFARSLLNAIDLSAVTGVRIRITASSNCTVRVLAVRLLAATWTYAPFDIDTQYDRGVRPVSPNGGASTAYTFPVDGQSFPTLWRADNPSGTGDPTPVDAHLSVGFNTGSISNANTISLFFRERDQDPMTMLDLDGTTMADLDGKPQPDFGTARYSARIQKDLNTLTQSDLNGTQQFDLERKIDLINSTYTEARLTWSNAGISLQIFDADTAGAHYTFSPNLNPNTDYILFAELEERSLRLRIFTLDSNQLGDPIFDSTKIVDPSVFQRRQGRLGWNISLTDGDAWVSHIRPRYLSFAEYRSHPYQSLTPIIGTQLQVGAAADQDLFQGIYPGPWGGQFEALPERGPEAFKIRNTVDTPLQGIQSQPIYFDDFLHTTIEVDVLMVQEAIDAGSFFAFLWDGVRPLSLPMGTLRGDIWNHVYIDLSTFASNTVPGYYSVVLIQSIGGLPNDWAIDKMSVNRRNISWYARAYTSDAWGLHEDDWIPFKDALNDSNDGIVFRERTNALQIKAQALRQDSFIGQMRVTPRYAELGRVVWDDEGFIPDATSAPTPSFSTSISGRKVTFTSTSTDHGYIANSSWSFGDGAADNGAVVVHTYASAGTYPATVIVTDDNGERASHTQNVTVA